MSHYTRVLSLNTIVYNGIQRTYFVVVACYYYLQFKVQTIVQVLLLSIQKQVRDAMNEGKVPK